MFVRLWAAFLRKPPQSSSVSALDPPFVSLRGCQWYQTECRTAGDAWDRLVSIHVHIRAMAYFRRDLGRFPVHGGLTALSLTMDALLSRVFTFHSTNTVEIIFGLAWRVAKPTLVSRRPLLPTLGRCSCLLGAAPNPWSSHPDALNSLSCCSNR